MYSWAAICSFSQPGCGHMCSGSWRLSAPDLRNSDDEVDCSLAESTQILVWSEFRHEILPMKICCLPIASDSAKASVCISFVGDCWHLGIILTLNLSRFAQSLLEILNLPTSRSFRRKHCLQNFDKIHNSHQQLSVSNVLTLQGLQNRDLVVLDQGKG